MIDVECFFPEDNPDTFPEISLELLLKVKDKTSLTCESEDGLYQIYYIADNPGQKKKHDPNENDGYFVKVKKEEVKKYLENLP